MWGFGKSTGIDIGDLPGRVPDRSWKRNYFKKSELKEWLPGDTVNMTIGQGDLLATPLQVARLYAAIANGGKFYKPKLISKVCSPEGKIIKTFKPEVEKVVDLSPSLSRFLLSSLRDVVTEGTAKSSFYGFSLPVSGKTGTAQVQGKDDYAWFVGLGPANDPQYVVCVLVEQGGHGGSVAAPAVRYIFSHLLGAGESSLVVGSDISR